MLGSATNGPTLSDDGARIRWLDGFDANQLAGALTELDLPSGKATVVAPNIQQNAAAFLFGGSIVYFIDNLGGGGTLWSWNGASPVQRAQSCYNFRTRSSPPRLYVTLSAPDASIGADTPGIWSLPP
jgi:hypothetical protein